MVLDPITAATQRTRIRELLLATGAITQQQLDHALTQQVSLKLPLGKVLLKLDYVSDETMRQALSAQLKVPYIDLEAVTIDRRLARVINRSYARRHSLLPIAQVGRTLTVAMDDPTAGAVIDDLMRLTGFAITVVTSPSRAIQRAFRRLYDNAPVTGERLGSDLVPATQVPFDPAMLAYEQTSRRADELFRQILFRA